MQEFIQFLSDMGTVWERYGNSILRGAGMTVLLAVICTALGCIIGFAVGTIQATPVSSRYNPAFRALVLLGHGLLRAYVEFFRGTPLMLQAMFIFYGAAYAFGLHMETFSAGIFILSINTGAYMAETVRGGILAIDPGQTEGAKAIGVARQDF